MEFFKKIKPEKESKVIGKMDNSIEEIIQDQKDFGIKSESSIENEDIETLNEHVSSGSEQIDTGTPFEEIEQQEQISTRFEDLMIRYNDLKTGIKAEGVNLDFLKQMKESAFSSAKNLNLKRLKESSASENLIKTMENAENRIERLSKQILNKEIIISQAEIELGKISAEIEMISGLMTRDKDEEPYNPGNN